jgi:hypothetical protein
MNSEPSVQQLYRKWREQNDDAVDDLAHRFDLWFEALSRFYYGRDFGISKNNACVKFSEEFSTVAKSTDLIPFAYTKVTSHIHPTGFPLHRPKVNRELNDKLGVIPEDQYHVTLIKKVFDQLPSNDQEILRIIYQQEQDLSSTLIDSEDLDDNQKVDFAYQGLLARENLKKLLEQNEEINFSTHFDGRDISPLPLYEGSKLTSEEEVERFERWLLTSTSLCQDLIEFTPYAHALRDLGIPNETVEIITDEPIAKEQTEDITKEITMENPEKEVDYGKMLLVGFLVLIGIIAVVILFAST